MFFDPTWICFLKKQKKKNLLHRYLIFLLKNNIHIGLGEYQEKL
jgi:hypothetical protein